MKLTALPILEGKGYQSLDIPNLTPHHFCNLLDSHKALVLQNPTNPLSVDDFGQLLVNLELEYYPYIGGAAPRTIIPTKASPDQDIIFTANESPPQEPIPFHHEIAQCPNPPTYIFFYCQTPPTKGGQTPIIDSTKVYRHVKECHPKFLQQLRTEGGVRYIRTLPAQDDPKSPLGRSWKNSYNVSTKQELETKLQETPDLTYQWLANDEIRIVSEPIPAIRLVSENNQNQVYQETFCNSIIAAYLGWQDERNDRHKAVVFGQSQTSLPEDVLDDISNFMKQERILYDWQAGDVLAIHNRLVMHSREPFEGPRKVLASIWGPLSQKLRLAQPFNNVALGLRPESFYQTPLERKEPNDPSVFGFWKVPKDICADVAYNAIKSGYRRLDCACDYGNEVEVGQGIARAIQEGIVTRSELFITSKLWNTFHKHVNVGFTKTLQDLGLDYLDEYLIHFPISMEYVPIDKKYPPEWHNEDGKMVLVAHDIGDTWRDMEELVRSQKVLQIGVCNFSTQLLRHILSIGTIRPTTLQVELHPHNSQERLIRFARDAGMHVTAFSVLGASSYIELGGATEADTLVANPVVTEIAAGLRKTPAQVLLRWALQRNTKPLCKTSNINRLVENRDLFDFYLNGAQMKALNGLNQNRRYNDPGDFCEGAFQTYCPIYE